MGTLRSTDGWKAGDVLKSTSVHVCLTCSFIDATEDNPHLYFPESYCVKHARGINKRRFRDETKDSVHSCVSIWTSLLLLLAILTTLKLILNYVPNRKQLRRNYLVLPPPHYRSTGFSHATQTPHVRRSRNEVYTERTISLDLGISRISVTYVLYLRQGARSPCRPYISDGRTGYCTLPVRFLFPSVVFLLLSRRRPACPYHCCLSVGSAAAWTRGRTRGGSWKCR